MIFRPLAARGLDRLSTLRVCALVAGGLVLVTSAAVRAEPDSPPVAPELAEVSAEIERRFSLAQRYLLSSHDNLVVRSSTLVSEELRAEIADREATGTESDAKLQSVLDERRAAAGIELVVYVGQDGVVVRSPPLDAAAPEEFVRAFVAASRRAADAALATSESRRGYASLPAPGASSSLPESSEFGETLYQVAASQIFVRPDVASGVLLGANPVSAMAEPVSLVADGGVIDLDWHLFRTPGAPGDARVVAGPRTGSTLLADFVTRLARDSVASGLAFEGETHSGRWEALVGFDGGVLGGWGLTVDETFLAALLRGDESDADASDSEPALELEAHDDVAALAEEKDESSDSSETASSSRGAILNIVFGVVGIAGCAALISLLVVAMLGARRRRRELDDDEGEYADPEAEWSESSETGLIAESPVEPEADGEEWEGEEPTDPAENKTEAASPMTEPESDLDPVEDDAAMTQVMNVPTFASMDDDEAPAETQVLPEIAPAPPPAPRRPQRAPEPPPPPKAPARSKKGDLLEEFEAHWKTFASYTQDRLDETLRNLEGAPQRDVSEIRQIVEEIAAMVGSLRVEVKESRERAAASDADELRAQLVEIHNEVSVARNEMKNSANGVVRRLTAFIHESSRTGPGAEQTDLLETVYDELARSRSELTSFQESFLSLVETIQNQQDHRTKQEDGETERLRDACAQWEERVAELKRDVDHLESQNTQLSEELEAARTNERELRTELDEFVSREVRIKAEVEDERSQIETVTSERDDACRRERELVEKLRVVEERENEGQQKIRALETSLDDLHQTIDEQRAQNAGLERELEQLRERSRSEGEHAEDRAQQAEEHLRELESRNETLEREKSELDAAVRRLESEAASLRDQKGDAAELGRLRVAHDGAQKELESVRKTLDAVKDEREHFEREARRLGADVERHQSEQSTSMRTLRADVDRLEAECSTKQNDLERERQQSKLHRETVERLRAELSEAELHLARKEAQISDLKRERGATAAPTAELEELQTSLRETTRELQASREERLRLNTERTELEAEWQSRVAALELRVTEADGKRAEVERERDKRQLERDQLEAQMQASREATRGDRHMLDRLQNLKREKEDLVRSIDQLKNELENASREMETIRRFQGTLIDGHLPAAIVACDADLRVWAWSAAAEKLWSRRSRDVCGQSLDDVDFGGTGEIVQLAQKTLKKGAGVHREQVSVANSSGTRHFRVSCDPIKGERQEVLGVVLAVEDVTEDVDRAVEARLQSLFAESLTESMPAALVVVDGRDRVTSWNRAAKELLGVPGEEAIGSELFSLKTSLRRKAFRDRYEKAKATGKPKKMRVRIDRDGTPLSVVVTQCPFRSRDREIRGTLLLIDAPESAGRR